jgi:hypothetical protein
MGPSRFHCANTSGNMADGMTLKLTPLTRDGNYKLWAGQVKSMLIVGNLLDKLLTSEPGEDADAKEKDTVCKARVMLCVSGPLRDVVERAGTAKEAWEALRQEYLGDLHARKPKLMDELTRLSQERGSIVDYIDSAKELRDKFGRPGVMRSKGLDGRRIYGSCAVMASHLTTGKLHKIACACHLVLPKAVQLRLPLAIPLAFAFTSSWLHGAMKEVVEVYATASAHSSPKTASHYRESQCWRFREWHEHIPVVIGEVTAVTRCIVGWMHACHQSLGPFIEALGSCWCHFS